MKVLLIGGESRSLINFRGTLIREIIGRGHEVFACAGNFDNNVAKTLNSWGAKYIPIKLQRAGMNPGRDIFACMQLLRVIHIYHPDTVLAYTIKPVIWGGVAARIMNVKNVYSMITGLGYAFRKESSSDWVFQSRGSCDNSTSNLLEGELKSRISILPKFPKQRLARSMACGLYRISLKFSKKVFFQNSDDLDDFIRLGLVEKEKGVVVNGSGVDLSFFSFKREYACSDKKVYNASGITGNQKGKFLSFLLIARLIKDKGIFEFAEAAKKIKEEFPKTEFHLIGDYDSNPTSLRPKDIKILEESQTIVYHGMQSDVRPYLKNSDIYVLPSYREGTPRTVLEAMAIGLPVITTDVPGCRETVTLSERGLKQKSMKQSVMEGENGLLVRPGDANAVASAMRYFIDRPDVIRKMGMRSRAIAERKYDVHKVNKIIMDEMGIFN
mgnify:CR=1 FL=1